MVLGDRGITGTTGLGRQGGEGMEHLTYSTESGKCYLNFQTVNTLGVLYTCLWGLETCRRMRGS